MSRYFPLVMPALVIAAIAGIAEAGCIGPVIMGKCQGQQVPWDTHTAAPKHPNPPPGFYWDWRGTSEARKHWDSVDPLTGKDAHDSQWSEPDRTDPDDSDW